MKVSVHQRFVEEMVNSKKIITRSECPKRLATLKGNWLWSERYCLVIAGLVKIIDYSLSLGKKPIDYFSYLFASVRKIAQCA
jgi:hypothetical protein